MAGRQRLLWGIPGAKPAFDTLTIHIIHAGTAVGNRLLHKINRKSEKYKVKALDKSWLYA